MDLELADRSIAIVPAAIPISQSEITTTTPAILQAPSLVVEYESLPTICFECGKYGNVRDICLLVLNSVSDLALPLSTQVIDPPAQQFAKPFGPWMLVKRRGRKSIRKETKPPNDKFRVGIEGSRFNLIFDVDGEETLAASKEQSILPSSSPAIPTPVSACVPASPREVPNQGMDFEVPIDNVNVDIAAPRNLGKKPVVPRPLRSTISPSVSPPKSSVSPSVRKSHEKRVH
ncbi:hypothetical protein V6N13_003316 [Hibiscus sabdariffa]